MWKQKSSVCKRARRSLPGCNHNKKMGVGGRDLCYVQACNVKSASWRRTFPVICFVPRALIILLSCANNEWYIAILGEFNTFIFQVNCFSASPREHSPPDLGIRCTWRRITRSYPIFVLRIGTELKGKHDRSFYVPMSTIYVIQMSPI